MTKAKAKAKAKTTKKKITQKNFKDYVMELLNASDSKGMTINSTDLLSGVEEKYDNEADIAL